MKALLFLFIGLLCLSASCKKEHLPEYYFKCKVDGKEYVPDNCANCRDAKILGDTIILVHGSRYIEVIAMGVVDNPIRENTYILKRSGSGGSAYYDNTIGNPSDIFRTDSIPMGHLTITLLDKTNKIISGTFSFEAYNAIQDKKVWITDGKFRLQYHTN